MDFVVVGFGVGALGVLLGLLARDVGSWWWRRRGLVGAPGSVARRVAAGRASRAGGRVLTLGGAAACLATLLALLLRLSDRTGALLVLAALVVATAGAIAWAAAYAHRYHPRPLRRRAPRPPATARDHEVADLLDVDPAATPAIVQPRPALLPVPSNAESVESGPIGSIAPNGELATKPKPDDGSTHLPVAGSVATTVPTAGDAALPLSFAATETLPAVTSDTTESTKTGGGTGESGDEDRDPDGETRPPEAARRVTTVGTAS